MDRKTKQVIPKQMGRDVMMERRHGMVTPREAARRSNTPLQTIYGWIHDGVLVHERVGRRRIYVSLDSLRGLVGSAMGTAG